MIYFELFLSFLQIGAFSFGGGYAAMPLIQNQVIDIHHWLSLSELSDLVTISQMTPGPIAINAATFVGIKVGGIVGAVVATLGCIMPACILVTLIARLYLKYRNLEVLQSVLKTLRPAVVALIGTAGLSIIVSALYPTSNTIYVPMVIIFGVCLYLLIRKDMNPITVMVMAGLMNVAWYYCSLFLNV